MTPPHSVSVSHAPSSMKPVLPKKPPAKFINEMSWSASSVVLVPPPSSIWPSEVLLTDALSVARL